MKSDDNEHYQASLMMHTGSLFFLAAEYRQLGQLRIGHGQPELTDVHGDRAAIAVRWSPGIQQRFSSR